MAPHVLVQFWDDASAVPDDVRECLESWALLEAAGFERMLFDDTSARHFIEDRFSARHVRAFDRCIHPAMRADYFRLCFMLRVGGLYVDADDEYQGADFEPLIGSCRLYLQALCYDTASDSMVDAAATAATAATERIYYVNNNPIITGPGHAVIARALERSTTLLLATREANRDIQSLTGPGNLTASLWLTPLSMTRTVKRGTSSCSRTGTRWQLASGLWATEPTGATGGTGCAARRWVAHEQALGRGLSAEPHTSLAASPSNVRLAPSRSRVLACQRVRCIESHLRDQPRPAT